MEGVNGVDGADGAGEAMQSKLLVGADDLTYPHYLVNGRAPGAPATSRGRAGQRVRSRRQPRPISTTATTADKDGAMDRAPATQHTAATYTVENMTCAGCLAEVMEAVRHLPHVTGVAVDLVVDGRSTLIVRSDAPVVPQVVVESVQGVGFRALPASARRARHLQRTFTGGAHGPDRGVAV